MFKTKKNNNRGEVKSTKTIFGMITPTTKSWRSSPYKIVDSAELDSIAKEVFIFNGMTDAAAAITCTYPLEAVFLVQGIAPSKESITDVLHFGKRALKTAYGPTADSIYNTCEISVHEDLRKREGTMKAQRSARNKAQEPEPSHSAEEEGEGKEEEEKSQDVSDEESASNPGELFEGANAVQDDDDDHTSISIDDIDATVRLMQLAANPEAPKDRSSKEEKKISDRIDFHNKHVLRLVRDIAAGQPLLESAVKQFDSLTIEEKVTKGTEYEKKMGNINHVRILMDLMRKSLNGNKSSGERYAQELKKFDDLTSVQDGNITI